MRRARLRVGLVVALGLLAAFVVWRACASGPSDVAVYVDSVRPLIQRSTDLARGLRTLPEEVPNLTRDILDQRLEAWSNESAKLEEELLAAKTKPGSLEIAAFLQTTFHGRTRGFVQLRAALSNAIDGVPNEQATEEVKAALQLFETSDRTYRFFADVSTESLKSTREEKVEVPQSQYLRDSALTVDGAQRFVKTVQSQPRLAPIHDVSVAQLQTRPAATGKQRDLDLLPSVRSFAVVVTITNEGNLPERDLVVRVRLTADTQPVPQEAEDRIQVLEPGGKRVLTFTGLNPATGEARNVLTAEVVAVDGERNHQNNRKEYVFAVRS